MAYDKHRSITSLPPIPVTWALLGAAALGSCKGEGVVDPHYPGTELASIRGQISATTPPETDSVSLGIVWVSVREQYANLGPGGFGGGGAGGEGGMGGHVAGEGGLAGTNAGVGGEAGVGPGGGGGEGGGAGAGGEPGAGPGLGGSEQPASGGSPGSGSGSGGGPHTVTTVRPRHSPGPNGSLLDPALIGCDGSPAAVAVDDGYSSKATPIAQTVSYQPTFPVDFTLSITTLPPDDALVPLDVAVAGEGHFATAHLVAFIDDNRNGRLDLPSAEGIPDRIIGVSTQQIAYLDGVFPPPEVAAHGHVPVSLLPLPYQAGPRLPQGYSIIDVSQNVLPASTPLDLPLAETKRELDDATLQVCGTFEERIEHFQPTQAAPNDAFIIPGGDAFGSGVAWHYYPDSGNPCYQLAFLGHLCK
jgi:hypothetical protein